MIISLKSLLNKEARQYQIFILSFLLIYGVATQKINTNTLNIVSIFLPAILLQFIFSLKYKIKFDIKSVFITSLSLSILLRSNYFWLLSAASVIAISSKFLIRLDNKHIFNPANIGIAALIFLSNNTWISPGQWGNSVILIFILLTLGIFLTTKVFRLDISLAFLLTYILCLIIRLLWLGDPASLLFHQINNGALFLFAFFMISDPKTTPINSYARIIFGVTTAVIAFILEYYLFTPQAIIYSLTITSPFTYLINKRYK